MAAMATTLTTLRQGQVRPMRSLDRQAVHGRVRGVSHARNVDSQASCRASGTQLGLAVSGHLVFPRRGSRPPDPLGSQSWVPMRGPCRALLSPHRRVSAKVPGVPLPAAAAKSHAGMRRRIRPVPCAQPCQIGTKFGARPGACRCLAKAGCAQALHRTRQAPPAALRSSCGIAFPPPAVHDQSLQEEPCHTSCASHASRTCCTRPQ